MLIPVFSEPVDVVEPTISAATKMSGARVNVCLLDDGDSLDMKRLARRYGIRYVTRETNAGAKAGNINNALTLTSAEFVAVFDCDHVPHSSFLERTLPYFWHPEIGFVQTPQFYANARERHGLCAAAWQQQALFFGPISRGKDKLGTMFCCGTNVVFRRAVLEDVGGFPEGSLTEDFEMSIGLHARGWNSAYISEILARGLGPEDAASYVSQQHRWARGCLASIPQILRSKTSLRMRLQYLLSATYFITGLSLAVYISLPLIRLVTGAQPLAEATADQFLLHFAPYFGIAILNVARFGHGLYGFGAFSLMAAYFWVHIRALWGLLMRRPIGFAVTPKKGAQARQVRAAAPTLTVVTLLVTASAYAILRDTGPATWNNVAFAMLHATVLLSGVWPALTRPKAAARRDARIVTDRRPPESPPACAPTGPDIHTGAEVDVILLTWDRIDMALQTIDTALGQVGVSVHIWIVDQGSRHHGLARLRARAARESRISLLELGRNCGPPAGRNAGIRLGRAPYIVTIDNDAVLASRHALRHARLRLERDRDIGVLAFRILNYTTGKEESWSYPHAMRSLAHEEFPAARFVTCGAAIRRTAFEQAGGFDETLFFCEEELDLSLKILDLGYRIVYDPNATVLHKVAPERRVKWDEDRFYFQTRNAVYLDYKHHRQPHRTLTMAAGYLAKSIYNGVADQALRGLADAAAMTWQDLRQGRPPGLSQRTRRYVRVNEDCYRGGLLDRIRREVLVKVRGIK